MTWRTTTQQKHIQQLGRLFVVRCNKRWCSVWRSAMGNFLCAKKGQAPKPVPDAVPDALDPGPDQGPDQGPDPTVFEGKVGKGETQWTKLGLQILRCQWSRTSRKQWQSWRKNSLDGSRKSPHTWRLVWFSTWVCNRGGSPGSALWRSWPLQLLHQWLWCQRGRRCVLSWKQSAACDLIEEQRTGVWIRSSL